MTAINRHAARRPGFTLMELIVVISIIAVLATLALLVAPRFGEQQRTSLGASQLQGWLFVAKNRAYRDQLNRGVRLFQDTSNANYVTQMQYTEQPDNFTAGTTAAAAAQGAQQVSFNLPSGVDFTTQPPNNIITPGQSYVVFPSVSSELAHLITSAQSANTLNLQTPLQSQVPASSPYYIIRPARVMQGEPTLQMPQNVAVDFTSLNGTTLSMPNTPAANIWTPNTGGQPYMDVLFTPSGAVQPLPGMSTEKFLFWVRDTSLDTVFQGQPVLIVVYARTGAIAAHPVDADASGNNADGKGFYYFTQDPRSSGM